MYNKIKILIIVFFLSLVMQNCLNLRSCEKNIYGKYYCKNDNKALNYLELKKDHSYFHYYKKDSIELYNTGHWNKIDDGYCKIELENWKNFNEAGPNYEEFLSAILFINGKYLDLSPDGESSTSFIKE